MTFLIFRAKIAEGVESIFGKFYWNAIYIVDMVVIFLACWGLHSCVDKSWKRIVIDFFLGAIFGDIIERIFFRNTLVTKYDLLAILFAILFPIVKYFIKNGKYRTNFIKN